MIYNEKMIVPVGHWQAHKSLQNGGAASTAPMPNENADAVASRQAQGRETCRGAKEAADWHSASGSGRGGKLERHMICCRTGLQHQQTTRTQH
jgi:hypothetical protein